MIMTNCSAGLCHSPLIRSKKPGPPAGDVAIFGWMGPSICISFQNESVEAAKGLRCLHPQLFYQLAQLFVRRIRMTGAGRCSERNPHADLDFAARRRGLGDRAELRRVHEAAGRPQVRMIERVEEFGAELEFHLFGYAELTGQREVQRLHSRAVYRIPSRIPE